MLVVSLRLFSDIVTHTRKSPVMVWSRGMASEQGDRQGRNRPIFSDGDRSDVRRRLAAYVGKGASPRA